MSALAILGAVAPLLGLAAAVLCHLAIARWSSAVPRPRALAASMGIGLLVTAVVSLTARPGAGLVAHALTFVLLAYGYVIGFFNLGESARRIRLVIELTQAGPRGLTLAEILHVYDARTILKLRMERLLAGGQVVERDGRYVLGRRLLLWAGKALVLMKVAFLGAPSEFSARERPSGR